MFEPQPFGLGSAHGCWDVRLPGWAVVASPCLASELGEALFRLQLLVGARVDRTAVSVETQS
jgi:hypothetical protein